jgi:hypothetical protein
VDGVGAATTEDARENLFLGVHRAVERPQSSPALNRIALLSGDTARALAPSAAPLTRSIETQEVEGAPVPEPPAHGFLVAYTLDRDGNEVMDEFVARISSGQMQVSDVMDFATVAMSVWQPIGPRRVED